MADKDKVRAKHAKYNGSAKGQARNRRYEEAHPERKTRWAPIMIIKARDRKALWNWQQVWPGRTGS
jgi:hypothetical protein